MIPEEVRRLAGIEAGMEVDVLYFTGGIHILPVLSLDEAEGALKGLDIRLEREKTDRQS